MQTSENKGQTSENKGPKTVIALDVDNTLLKGHSHSFFNTLRSEYASFTKLKSTELPFKSAEAAYAALINSYKNHEEVSNIIYDSNSNQNSNLDYMRKEVKWGNCAFKDLQGTLAIFRSAHEKGHVVVLATNSKYPEFLEAMLEKIAQKAEESGEKSLADFIKATPVYFGYNTEKPIHTTDYKPENHPQVHHIQSDTTTERKDLKKNIFREIARNHLPVGGKFVLFDDKKENLNALRECVQNESIDIETVLCPLDNLFKSYQNTNMQQFMLEGKNTQQNLAHTAPVHNQQTSSVVPPSIAQSQQQNYVQPNYSQQSNYYQPNAPVTNTWKSYKPTGAQQQQGNNNNQQSTQQQQVSKIEPKKFMEQVNQLRAGFSTQEANTGLLKMISQNQIHESQKDALFLAAILNNEKKIKEVIQNKNARYDPYNKAFFTLIEHLESNFFKYAELIDDQEMLNDLYNGPLKHINGLEKLFKKQIEAKIVELANNPNKASSEEIDGLARVMMIETSPSSSLYRIDFPENLNNKDDLVMFKNIIKVLGKERFYKVYQKGRSEFGNLYSNLDDTNSDNKSLTKKEYSIPELYQQLTDNWEQDEKTIDSFHQARHVTTIMREEEGMQREEEKKQREVKNNQTHGGTSNQPNTNNNSLQQPQTSTNYQNMHGGSTQNVSQPGKGQQSGGNNNNGQPNYSQQSYNQPNTNNNSLQQPQTSTNYQNMYGGSTQNVSQQGNRNNGQPNTNVGQPRAQNLNPHAKQTERVEETPKKKHGLGKLFEKIKCTN